LGKGRWGRGEPVIVRLDRTIQYSRALIRLRISGILDIPLEPVIGLAEGETR
jgi:hypothetical protein